MNFKLPLFFVPVLLALPLISMQTDVKQAGFDTGSNFDFSFQPPVVGNWSDIRDASYEKLLRAGYKAVTANGYWPLFKNIRPEFDSENESHQLMWQQIGNHVDAEYTLTGASFYWLLGTLHLLANTSWEELLSQLNPKLPTSSEDSSSYVGNVVSKEGAVRIVQSDSDGCCEVKIYSSADLQVGEINARGNVTLVENDPTLGRKADEIQVQLPNFDSPILATKVEKTTPYPHKDKEKGIDGERIMGTELHCNYDLWSLRNIKSSRQIRGPIIFSHRDSGKQLVTEYTGLVIGPNEHQKSEVISGRNIAQVKLKTVNDFAELMIWVREIVSVLQ